MMLYKLVNGTPVAPPQNGVSADGRVISNFSGRVLHDMAFAKANGYSFNPEEEEVESVAPDETKAAPADEVLEE